MIPKITKGGFIKIICMKKKRKCNKSSEDYRSRVGSDPKDNERWFL